MKALSKVKDFFVWLWNQIAQTPQAIKAAVGIIVLVLIGSVGIFYNRRSEMLSKLKFAEAKIRHDIKIEQLKVEDEKNDAKISELKLKEQVIKAKIEEVKRAPDIDLEKISLEELDSFFDKRGF
jgi:predicted Holliday junction resolvase-like endonuclease